MIKLSRKMLITLLMTLVMVWAWCSVALAVDCFDCHDRSSFKGRVVHAPLQKGECVSCHSPHVSRHDGLLLETQQNLCFGCHQAMQKRIEAKEVAHQPVRKGECSACHDPHASNHANLLSGNLAESCSACHEQIKEAFARKHAPFAKGQCNACHDPHAANDYRLIKQSDPGLCLSCHTQQDRLKKKHMGRSPQSMACLECHNPHGGKNSNLLRKVQHEPFAKKDCKACHSRKNEGMYLCLQCHDDILGSFNHVNSHLLGAGDVNPCTRCHTPHASERPGLMPGSPGSVCRNCHIDTFERRQNMLHQHPEWQNCSACHALHGSDFPNMLNNEPDQVCAVCHEEHTTFVHPIGDDALDPRNSRPMTCLSCHDANVGTMYKYNLRGSGERGLCIKCHQGY